MRYQIVNEDNEPVVTFSATGVFPPVTYGSMTEATLALIFLYPEHVHLRAVPVTGPVAKLPRIES